MADASVLNAPKRTLGCGWIANCKRCGADFHCKSWMALFCSEECRFVEYQNAGSPDECWDWTGPASGRDGYGAMFLNQNNAAGKRIQMTAHRYSFIRAYGPLAPEKPCVLHRCDNPRCTNPKHLFPGDWVDNNKDRSAKGRSGERIFSDAERREYSLVTRGEGNPSSKLTEQQARAIKYEHPELSNREVGALYGVSKPAAGLIRRGINWKHI